MDKVLITIAVIIGVAAVAAPIAGMVLVSLASLREESWRSLKGAPPGPIAHLARRVLGFRSDRPAAAKVRFAHARHTLPDPRLQPTGSESQPGTLGLDERESALV